MPLAGSASSEKRVEALRKALGGDDLFVEETLREVAEVLGIQEEQACSGNPFASDVGDGIAFTDARWQGAGLGGPQWRPAKLRAQSDLRARLAPRLMLAIAWTVRTRKLGSVEWREVIYGCVSTTTATEQANS